MMNEERVKEEIEKLEQQKMTLFGHYNQVEGALATMRAVLNPGPETVTEAELVE